MPTIPFFELKLNIILLNKNFIKILNLLNFVRYKIPFEVNDFKSFIHSRFADTDYLYLFADSTVLVLKVFSGFVISFPDENIDYLKQTKGLYFNLVANNNEQRVTQQVNLYTVQSGIVLKSGSKHIQLHAPKDFKKYYINLDDYFKGFRR